MKQEDLKGAQFLHERRPKLHSSPGVAAVIEYLRQNAQCQAKDSQPETKIAEYLGFLARNVKDGLLTGQKSSLTRQIDCQIISKDKLKKNEDGDYWRDYQLDQAVKEARINQEASLSTWMTYVSGRDARYPKWFKFYVADGLFEMGLRDSKTREFKKRSLSTLDPYPELRPGALAKVYDWIVDSYIDPDDQKQAQVFDSMDEELSARVKKAINSKKFDLLYSCALDAVGECQITEEQKLQTQGEWKFYQDDKELFDDLQGFGLDWCIATGRKTVNNYLHRGHFALYRTFDANGDPKIPRIGISLAFGKVSEVRGINSNQEIEPVMFPIALEKIQGLPGGAHFSSYLRSAYKLLSLERRTARSSTIAQISKNETAFLYEIDNKINVEDSKRVKKLQCLRYQEDSPVIFELTKERLVSQLEGSFNSYIEAARDLRLDQSSVLTKPEFEKIFIDNLKTWEEQGALEYIIKARMESEGMQKYLVVAVPNVSLTSRRALQLIEKFALKQARSVNYGPNVVESMSASDSTIEFKKPNLLKVNFVLMPYGSILGKEAAEELQATYSKDAKIGPTSLFQSIMSWYTVRGLTGKKVYGNNVGSSTLSCHPSLKMADKARSKNDFYLHSQVDDNGDIKVFYNFRSDSIRWVIQ